MKKFLCFGLLSVFVLVLSTCDISNIACQIGADLNNDFCANDDEVNVATSKKKSTEWGIKSIKFYSDHNPVMQKLLPNTVDEFGDTVASYAEAFNISSNVTINGETYDEIWDVMFPYQILNTDDGVKVDLLVYVELSDREVQLSTRNLNRIKSDKVVYTITKNGVERKILLRVLVAPESVPIAASVKYNGINLKSDGTNSWYLEGFPWEVTLLEKKGGPLDIKWWGDVDFQIDEPNFNNTKYKFIVNKTTYIFKLDKKVPLVDYPLRAYLVSGVHEMSSNLFLDKNINVIYLNDIANNNANNNVLYLDFSDGIIIDEDSIKISKTAFYEHKLNEKKNKIEFKVKDINPNQDYNVSEEYLSFRVFNDENKISKVWKIVGNPIIGEKFMMLVDNEADNKFLDVKYNLSEFNVKLDELDEKDDTLGRSGLLINWVDDSLVKVYKWDGLRDVVTGIRKIYVRSNVNFNMFRLNKWDDITRSRPYTYDTRFSYWSKYYGLKQWQWAGKIHETANSNWKNVRWEGTWINASWSTSREFLHENVVAVDDDNYKFNVLVNQFDTDLLTDNVIKLLSIKETVNLSRDWGGYDYDQGEGDKKEKCSWSTNLIPCGGKYYEWVQPSIEDVLSKYSNWGDRFDSQSGSVYWKNDGIASSRRKASGSVELVTEVYLVF